MDHLSVNPWLVAQPTQYLLLNTAFAADIHACGGWNAHAFPETPFEARHGFDELCSIARKIAMKAPLMGSMVVSG